MTRARIESRSARKTIRVSSVDMSNVGQVERATQNRVIQLFRDTLGYTYLGDWEDRPNNNNVEETYVRVYLTRHGYSDTLITKAIAELRKAADDQTQDLYYVNRDVYSLLRYGINVREDVGTLMQTVHLIDWEHPLNNDFYIAEEVTVKGVNDKRPDLVLYINGIAIGVLELKRSTISVERGIRQNLASQKSMFIQPFFATMQLVMAGNDSEGLRYGTIETEEKYYLTWKEDPRYSRLEATLADAAKACASPLDRDLIHLCHKARLVEILHDFTAFDAGVKKIARSNQYFAVKEAQAFLQRREGGIIWNTQGSGKSLIMVWLAKWIREHMTNSRVLIITDRTELDEQIEQVFNGVDEDIYRTKSGKDLLETLNAATEPLMCSLIHKFGNREEGDVKGYIAELQSNIPKDFSAKGDVYVFIDECHRTQSGVLHEAMKKFLPNSVMIGFTGTPLLKADKKSSLEVFGPYIHTYKYDEAVADGVVLDLRYEARDIDQDLSSREKVDQLFDAKTRGLNDYARAKLKARWGNMQSIYSAKSRLEKIVNDILLDMETRPRLRSERGNALLVAGSIYEACTLYDLFQQAGFTKCAIVTSYDPRVSDIKDEETGAGLTEKTRQYEIYTKMLKGKTVEAFEKEVKKKFVKEPGQMRLLIVVDKLLTGFDAPPATYLYIDKTMRDHGLFQAICRVNRLDGEDKDYGYIVDYKDLFQSLDKAVKDYTSGELDGYDKTDVEGLLTDRIAQAKADLEKARENIQTLCESVAPPRDEADYIRYFCGADTTNPDELQANAPRRQALYKQTAAFLRAYANLADDMDKAGYSATQTAEIEKQVAYFTAVREVVKIASGENVDLKAYEPDMRQLIDAYVRSEESKKISAFDDLTLLQMIVERGAAAVDALPEGVKKNREAVAESIEFNLRKVIIDEQPNNPKYYEKMSELLTQLIQKRRQRAVEYEAYLAQVVELTKAVKGAGNANAYPNTLDTPAKRALYDNLGQNEQLALDVDAAVRASIQDGWRGNPLKTRYVENAVKRFVPSEDVGRILELVKNQTEY